MKIHIIIFSLLFIASFAFSCKAQTGTSLDANNFEKSITAKDSIQILDVRTPGEFNSGHIKGALLADWNNKEEYNRRIAYIDKNKPVYIYCLAGSRSAAAAKQLRAEGYKEVYELSGGINAWKAANKPVEGKSTAKQMSMDEFNTAINAAPVVLVDFGADWCPPCRTMEPVLKNLATNNAGKFVLVKVDGGKDEDILKAYNVTALPVFIVFKNGKQVWRKEAVVTEKEIAEQF